MILDFLTDDEASKPSGHFMQLFSSVNFVYVNPKRPVEEQVAYIEDQMGEPSLDRMLVYSAKHKLLGIVLSRRYPNAAMLDRGPLKLDDTYLSPDHISKLPRRSKPGRILFLAPHLDEAYLGMATLHKQFGDQVFIHSFTSPKDMKRRAKVAYRLLGLETDEYSLGSLPLNKLFKQREQVKETIREFLTDIRPTTVLSVFPEGANFDHAAIAKSTREVVLKESSADLIYGYVIQSRHKNPTIFPLFPKFVYDTILTAYGKRGMGKFFEKYVAFLKAYMQTYSEPILRMIGERKLSNVYSLPLQPERASTYRIPYLLGETR